MGTITINSEDLKKLIRETFIDVLTARKDLIEDAVVDAIEDIGLGRAMEEGKTGEYIDSKEFIEDLKSKIKSSK
jgi:lipoate-protein ligase B